MDRSHNGPGGNRVHRLPGRSHLSGLFVILAGLDVVFAVQAAHKVVLNLADKHPQTAEQSADRLSLIAQLIAAAVVALASVGTARGWMHGTFRDVVGGALVLALICAPIWWFGGKHRLIAMLQARDGGADPASDS